LGSLGKHSSSESSRLARRWPAATAPAVLGVAAAFAVAYAPAASASAAQTPAQHPAAAVATAHSAAQLTSVSRPATVVKTAAAVHKSAAKHSSAAPAKYTVKSGDTLSSIAKRVYQDPDFWPALYWANHSQIRYANVIQVGQVLTVPAKPAHVPAPPSTLSPAPAPAPAPVTRTTTSDTAPAESAPVQSAPVEAAPVQQAAPVRDTSVSTAGDSSFQQCVIARESGGNSQVMNSSGHYGLYQFSASTWAAYGGNPADFGHASAAEQNQVFNNAIAAGGQSNWSAYDGC
jgi:LysM repeat protein